MSATAPTRSPARRRATPPRRNRPVAPPRTSPRDNPSMFDAERADPTLDVPTASRLTQVRDQQRWTRRYLEPPAIVASMATIVAAYSVKRLVPVPLSWPDGMNAVAPVVGRHLVSEESLDFLLRHLTYETNLINFVIRNSGATDIEEVTLRPTSAAGLGDDGGLNAVVRHDANIYNLIIDLGASASADVVTTRPLDELDFSMLVVPPFDLEPGARRPVPLDLHTSVQVIVALLAVFMDADTAERGINSLNVDASLFECLSNLTGDEMFRWWTPEKFTNHLGWSANIGRDLHHHMIVTEYAHERLRRLGTGEALPSG